MPIIRPEPTAVCDGCDKPLEVMVDNDLPEGSEDTHLPEGWVHVLLRKTEPNPAYQLTLAQIRQSVDAEVAQAQAQEIELDMNLVALQRQAAEDAIEEFEHHIAVIEAALCPDCNTLPQGWGLDEWETEAV